MTFHPFISEFVTMKPSYLQNPKGKVPTNSNSCPNISQRDYCTAQKTMKVSAEKPKSLPFVFFSHTATENSQIGDAFFEAWT